MSDHDPMDDPPDEVGPHGGVGPDAADDAAAGGDDLMRQAAQELLQAARGFLDAAERTLSDDETMQRWTDRGQDLVRGFLAGLTADAGTTRRPDDDDGIEHIPVD